MVSGWASGLARAAIREWVVAWARMSVRGWAVGMEVAVSGGGGVSVGGGGGVGAGVGVGVGSKWLSGWEWDWAMARRSCRSAGLWARAETDRRRLKVKATTTLHSASVPMARPNFPRKPTLTVLVI